MTLDQARARLFDTGFLLGGWRRRGAIRTLAAAPDPVGVLALASALGQHHPKPREIIKALAELSPRADALKLEALWAHLAKQPSPRLAGVLARLGWPPDRVMPAQIGRDLLALARKDAAPEMLAAAASAARALPVDDEAVNEAIYSAWMRSESAKLQGLIAEQGRRPGTASVLALAEVMNKKGHPLARACEDVLHGLSPDKEADKIEALWAAFAREPTQALGKLLLKLAWPPGRPVPAKLARDVLAMATAGAAPEVLQAVVVIARTLTLDDEAGNDAIYAAWVRSQSPDLERLIAEQGRQPASPALEALHALVSGRLEHYAALQDRDGALLVQAFALAPEPFRARLAQSVAATPDRAIKEAYRRALTSGAVDKAQRIENLELVGDEDGLFEQTRSLRLLDVLGLCERWAGSPSRPSAPAHRAAVDRAVEAYRSLGAFQVDPGPKLPDGLVDLFDYWRAERPSDADLRADLTADDPFQKARGLYLGSEQGLVDAKRLAEAARSEHWPERLMARLIDPNALAGAPEDHVLWVNACAGDASLLSAAIGGTPEDYARHSTLLRQASGPAAGRTRALLSILCTFQGVFVAGGITLDETAEPSDRRAVEVEEAGEVQF